MRRLALVMLVLSLPAWGADKDGNFAFVAPTCGQFVATEGHGKFQWGWWMQGYLAAYNLLTPNTVSILGTSDLPSATLWMDKWCKANPLRSVVEGMQELTAELYLRRHKTMKEAGR